MNYKKSGSDISNNMEISSNIDTKTVPETGTETKMQPRGFSAKKNIIIIALAGVLALGIGGTAAFGISNMPVNQISRYMGAAERYLSEMNYEQAVIEYQRVLEIEPMNVDAYLGLAESYLGLGDTEKAREILLKGLEVTGDPLRQAKIDALAKAETY